MTQPIPLTLVREQLPAISGMTAGLFWSLTPKAIKARLVDQGQPLTATVAAGSDKLVKHYIDWCGVNNDRYAGVLPPHFFAKYGMGMMARLTGQAPYNMLSVVNQGCRMQVNSLIARQTPIRLEGNLVACTRENNRVRVHCRVTAGTDAQPQALIVDSLAAVMLGKPSGKKGKRPASEANVTDYETVGSWSAARDEGQKFFLLTGDFNPIHTLWPVARRTRFGGCILHGFASYARTYETILNAGYGISDIDIRFLKPNLLPNYDLAVQVGKQVQADSRRPLRLVGRNGDVYLAGHFIE